MSRTRMRMKAVQMVFRYFQLIPRVPMALMSASLATAIGALRRVRRLEHQLAA